MKVEKATIVEKKMEKATINKKIRKKIKLAEYHSIEYLKKQVNNGENVVFILPNGKEIEING